MSSPYLLDWASAQEACEYREVETRQNRGPAARAVAAERQDMASSPSRWTWLRVIEQARHGDVRHLLELLLMPT